MGFLDWASQPDPFRRFEGAEKIQLPLMPSDDTPPYGKIYRREGIPAQPVTIETIGQLFELSMAISAWKEFQGSRWALRVNPSSGNLHPTEGYLVIGPSRGEEEVDGLGAIPRVCHYAPIDHALEVRSEFSVETWHRIMEPFPPHAFLVGLSSIHWREAWKYGERAFRYCQHDAGHALAALSISAAALGWQLLQLEDLADAEVSALLGLNREDGFHPLEREHPDLLAVVIPDPEGKPVPRSLPANCIQEIASSKWFGQPNHLSSEHVDWDIIQLVAEAAEKPRTQAAVSVLPAPAKSTEPLDQGQMAATLPFDESSAHKIILQRRSAVAFDGRTSIGVDLFYHILAQTLPWRPDWGAKGAPWDAVAWEPCIHLCLFVHLVEGIPPGLYALVRDPGKEAALRASMKPDFLWEKPPGCPGWLPLYLLRTGDARALAAQVSCGQDIAGYGAFSLGMVAEFRDSLDQTGPWHYRRLLWETGMIGQVLYLEAEAAGIRATGIGCFFDDPVHEVFGFSGWDYQSLYHFTMGGPVEDARLTTLPAYGYGHKIYRLPSTCCMLLSL
jgi:SagB-type dehydrogenase family enzyme